MCNVFLRILCEIRRKPDIANICITFVLYAVPETSKTHELPILSLRIMRDLLLSAIFLQPLVEALGHDYAPLFLLHSVPHTAVRRQRIIASIDCLHDGTIVWVSLRPERYETPLHSLEFVSGFFWVLQILRARAMVTLSIAFPIMVSTACPMVWHVCPID